MTTKKQVQLSELSQIPEGEFLMGSNNHYAEESSQHSVYIDKFQIEKTPVTNEQFNLFIEETGYTTLAERPLDPKLFPGAPKENLLPGSLVFYPSPGPVDLRHMSQWWAWTTGASWKNPEGAGTNLEKRWEHPVVHIAYEDAVAYSEWAGRRLPTEAEWERAARGNNEGADFAWGMDKNPSGKRMAKYYQGKFPWKNKASDGFKRTAPVGYYPAGGFGLYDMTGNVWEWTHDWYSEYPENTKKKTDEEKGCCVPQNPIGGEKANSFDPRQPQFKVPRKVIKGGSFLCADEYCMRYRPAARRPQMIDTSMSHVGFRCAL